MSKHKDEDIERSLSRLWTVSVFIWIGVGGALFYLYAAVKLLLTLVL